MAGVGIEGDSRLFSRISASHGATTCQECGIGVLHCACRCRVLCARLCLSPPQKGRRQRRTKSATPQTANHFVGAFCAPQHKTQAAQAGHCVGDISSPRSFALTPQSRTVTRDCVKGGRGSHYRLTYRPRSPPLALLALLALFGSVARSRARPFTRR